MRTRLFAFVISTLVLLLATACSSKNASRLERALLSDEWQRAADECGADDAIASRPVLRAIKGHAYLALNRSNESLQMFASIASRSDQQAWDRWTSDFVKRNSEAPVAWYLHGDSLARQMKWTAAAEAFSHALSIRKDWYLALNARGVVLHALNRPEKAREDFFVASNMRKDFADALASRGTLNILVHNNKDAESRFQSTSQLAPDSWLVANGLGCSAYGEQQYQEAQKHFDSIPSDSVLAALAQQNSLSAGISRFANNISRAQKTGMNLKIQSFDFVREIDGKKWKSEGDFWNWVLEKAYKLLERLKEEYRRNCSGKNASSEYCKRLAKQIEDLENDINDFIGRGGGSSLKEPGVATVPSILVGPVAIPSIPGPWAMDAIQNSDRQRAWRSLFDAESTEIEHALLLPEKPALSQGNLYGGVDASGIARVRTDAGKWVVYSVYGLLYDVPLALLNDKTTSGMKKSGR